MATSPHDLILAAVLDAWDRHNTVLLNLLRAVPSGAFDARAMTGSPTVAELFTHMHHERMVSVRENAPECAGVMPVQEWLHEPDAGRVATMLRDSAARVRHAVEGRIAAERSLDQDFAHPVQLITFLIFHEGYHHGQIKLALKAAGCPVPDAEAGPLFWDEWRRKSEK